MNKVFCAIIFIAFGYAAFQQFGWDSTSADIAPMQQLSTGIIESAKSSVSLALGLIGVMALFLGLMQIAEAGGLLTNIARLVRPLMTRLFPDVPAEHPAMGAMIMNISANVLGLGNAATPFGIRAMQELDKLNPHKGTASNAMCLFLAINTSSVTLLPTGVIALRASAGSIDPAAIIPTTLFATVCSTLVAIAAAKFYQRFTTPATDFDNTNTPSQPPHTTTLDNDNEEQIQLHPPYPTWVNILVLTIFLSLIPMSILYAQHISMWIIPTLIVSLLAFGVYKKVQVYECFVEGAKEGFNVAVRIIPYLVAILVAVGMLRESGALNLFTTLIGQFSEPLGMPADALPMALLRPLSGSGAYGVMASIIEDPNIGPDSYTGLLVSTLQGSTETTFYVLAVYFGAVQIKNVRHALAAGLTADMMGIIAAVLACSVLFAAIA